MAKNIWRSVLTIRFIFTFLLAGLVGLLGWYSVGEFLIWVRRDEVLGTLFGKTEATVLAYVYQGIFVAVGGIFGFALGGFVFRQIEMTGERLRVMSAREKIALIGGMIVGLILTAIISIPLILVIAQKIIAVGVCLLLGIALSYLCTVAALSMKEEIHIYMPPPAEEEKIPQDNYKILDTNVIIDGRVADVARSGFIEGPIYIPGFVLDELQHIADSADSLKRQRGRRGLDVLDQMKKDLPKLTVRTYDRLAPPGEEVDARLVRLAKALGGTLVTNDWNLNKVAGLQGVVVLNINELANAVKPVVLPGEDLQVMLVKEGKEPTQGVGYLEDGTMIVVAGGRTHLGETVGVRVTSLMQTVQGKMIFAQLANDNSDMSEDGYDNSGVSGDGYGSGPGMRSYSRGGSRRPVRREGK